MELEFDQITEEPFDWIFAPTTNVSEFNRARHRLMTDKCPNIPTLEKVARGEGTLRQLIHRNTCASCLKSVAAFRELLGIRPWWEELQASLRRAIRETSEMLVVEAGTAVGRRVKAKVLLPDAGLKPVMVNLAQCRFSGPNKLWMLVDLEQPLAEIGNNPVELNVLAANGENVFGPYVFANLNRGQKERLLLFLPSALEEEWRKQSIETSRTVPFQFVLRPFALTS
jgi:hypothetical protein